MTTALNDVIFCSLWYQPSGLKQSSEVTGNGRIQKTTYELLTAVNSNQLCSLHYFHHDTNQINLNDLMFFCYCMSHQELVQWLADIWLLLVVSQQSAEIMLHFWNGLLCADVPLRTYIYFQWWRKGVCRPRQTLSVLPPGQEFH